MKFRGLAFRLSIVFLTGILVIFTVSFLYTFSYTRTILLKEAERRATLLTDITMARLEAVLKPLEQVPVSLVNALNTDSPDPYQLLLITQKVILENPVVFASCIAFEPRRYDADNQYYAHYIYETGTGIGSKRLGGTYNYFEKDWYRQPKEKGIPMWIGPYFDTGGGDTLMCTYSVPFYTDVQGVETFAGVLTMDLSLSALSAIVSSVGVSQAGYAFLLSRDGRMITAPRPSYYNKQILELTGRKNDKAVINISRMLGGVRGFVRMDRFNNGEPGWLYYAPMPSTGWIFAVMYPEEELFSDLYDFFRRLLVIFVASVLAILVAVILISRNLAKPIARLAQATKQIGEGDFHAPIPKIRSRSEIGELAGSFAVMQGALNDYIENLKQATAAREKIEGELNVAHTIQAGLLPTAFPVRPEIDLYAELISAKSIGGDLYDFFFLDDDRLFMVIGDVSGKGVPASLFMTITRTLFRSLAGPNIPLHETVMQVNTELCKDNASLIFVTFIAGVLRLSTGMLELCNGGHDLPYLRSSGGYVRPLALNTNLPLGIREDFSYESDVLGLNPGDQIIFCTDGISEAESAEAKFFTKERLEKTLSVGGLFSSADLAARILGEVRSFTAGAEQSDDLTLMVLTFLEKALVREVILKNQIGELGKLKAAIDRLPGEWRLSSADMGTLNLVLEELFTNIVFYGFDDGNEHLIRILFRKQQQDLVITIEDDGKPFNILESVYKGFASTLEDREVGGEGIHLVKELMESVEYRRGEGKNSVIMKKKIN